MKAIIPFLIAFLIFSAGCKNSPGVTSGKGSEAKDTATLSLTKAEFKVTGMHCTGCENTIKNNVKDIKGVKTVDASFKENIAIVSFDSTKTNETAITAAIEDAGYKVDTFMRK